MEANPLRGEAEFTHRGVTVVLAMTNDALARLDDIWGGLTLQEMFVRLHGFGYGTLKVALPILAVKAVDDKGEQLPLVKTVNEVWSNMPAQDIATVIGPAIVKLTAPFLKIDEPAGNAAAPTPEKPSRSVN